MDALEAGVVPADVVSGPERAEELAPCRELADEVRELAIVRIATCLGAQDGDDVVRDAVPLRVESSGAIVEEDEPRGVRRLRRGIEVLRVERTAEAVCAEDVKPAVANIASSMCCTDGRMRGCARRRLRVVAGCVERARSNRCARSGSSSCSARASASSTESETPPALPRSSRV